VLRYATESDSKGESRASCDPPVPRERHHRWLAGRERHTPGLLAVLVRRARFSRPSTAQSLVAEYPMRLMLALAVGAVFVLAGLLFDSSYQRSTPGAVHVQGTVVGFERPHPRQVYPIFDFTDEDGHLHHVVNSSQQAIVRFAAGDAVAIAYSRFDPQRARIDTLWFNHRWAMAGFFVAFTLVFGARARREAGPN
jgi:hypothetical protein